MRPSSSWLQSAIARVHSFVSDAEVAYIYMEVLYLILSQVFSKYMYVSFEFCVYRVTLAYLQRHLQEQRKVTKEMTYRANLLHISIYI